VGHEPTSIQIDSGVNDDSAPDSAVSSHTGNGTSIYGVQRAPTGLALPRPPELDLRNATVNPSASSSHTSDERSDTLVGSNSDEKSADNTTRKIQVDKPCIQPSQTPQPFATVSFPGPLFPDLDQNTTKQTSGTRGELRGPAYVNVADH